MVEFNENGVIKPKVYPSNCIVNSEEYWSIIMITYDEWIFSVNNGV